MKIQTNFNKFLEEKERKNGNVISLKEIADETLLSVDVLTLMQTSHYNDISCIPIGELLTASNYFKAKFYDFVKIEDVIQTSHESNENKSETITPHAISPSRCGTGEEFKRAIIKSKYYTIYASVPTLIDSIANLIDNNSGTLLVGTVSNFNLKLSDENVLIRFFAKWNKIYIKDILFGKAIGLDSRGLYKEIYKNYRVISKKDSVDTAQDVNNLISLVNDIIK